MRQGYFPSREDPTIFQRFPSACLLGWGICIKRNCGSDTRIPWVRSCVRFSDAWGHISLLLDFKELRFFTCFTNCVFSPLLTFRPWGWLHCRCWSQGPRLNKLRAYSVKSHYSISLQPAAPVWSVPNYMCLSAARVKVQFQEVISKLSLKGGAFQWVDGFSCPSSLRSLRHIPKPPESEHLDNEGV